MPPKKVSQKKSTKKIQQLHERGKVCQQLALAMLIETRSPAINRALASITICEECGSFM
jgi:hypothetical protein